MPDHVFDHAYRCDQPITQPLYEPVSVIQGGCLTITTGFGCSTDEAPLAPYVPVVEQVE